MGDSDLESIEGNSKREYSSLNNAEKVYAILGTVRGPVSKNYAIKLSGIDYENLPEDQKLEVNSVFGHEDIETTEEGEITKYRLSDEKREELRESVDVLTVLQVIVDQQTRELKDEGLIDK